jgi:hypothetical protein
LRHLHTIKTINGVIAIRITGGFDNTTAADTGTGFIWIAIAFVNTIKSAIAVTVS